MQWLAPTAAGQVLKSSGSSAPYTVSWGSASGTGTVTSVAVTSTTATVTGSPITSSGTIDIEIPNWSTVAPSANVNMNSFGIAGAAHVWATQMATDPNGTSSIDGHFSLEINSGDTTLFNGIYFAPNTGISFSTLEPNEFVIYNEGDGNLSVLLAGSSTTQGNALVYNNQDIITSSGYLHKNFIVTTGTSDGIHKRWEPLAPPTVQSQLIYQLSSDSIVWNELSGIAATGNSGSPFSPNSNQSYIAFEDAGDPTSSTVFILPVSAAIGTTFRVVGRNPHGWSIIANGSSPTPQIFAFGNAFSSLGGSIGPSSAEADGTHYCFTSVELMYVGNNLEPAEMWVVINAVGNIELI
jgi:hypothetical protein